MRSRGRERAERVTPRRVSLGVLPRVAVRLQQGQCVWPPEASETGPRASRMHGPPAASAPSAARSAGVPAPRVAAGAGGTAPACTTSARRPATRTSTCRRARSTAALAASSSMTWRPARAAAWTPRRCVAACLAVLWSGHDALPAGGAGPGAEAARCYAVTRLVVLRSAGTAKMARRKHCKRVAPSYHYYCHIVSVSACKAALGCAAAHHGVPRFVSAAAVAKSAAE